MAIERIILSSFALALGVVTSGYFIVRWWRHRDGAHGRSLLFWAIGLFLMYWFQVPAILVGFGKVVTITDFNLFFALTLPITFLALMLFYLGILRISGTFLTKKKKLVFSSWMASAIAFFVYQFIIQRGIVSEYPLPLVGNIAFYLPMRAMIIFAAIRLFYRSEARTIYGILGAGGVIAESVLGLTRNFFVIKNVLQYPPQFWYAVIADSRFFFITQTISIIILVVGFYFLHRAFHRRRLNANTSKKSG